MKNIIELAEREDEVLIRLEDSITFGDKSFKTVRHEWWTSREKMNSGIHGEDGRIYCRGFAGSTDEQVIRLFNHELF